MAYRLWAIDAAGGQACLIEDEERWQLISADTDWAPIALSGPADAVHWATTSNATACDEEYSGLDETIARVRAAYLAARSEEPPHIAEIFELWRDEEFDPGDIWTAEARQSTVFWAYWLELVERTVARWERELKQPSLRRSRQAAFAIHILFSDLSNRAPVPTSRTPAEISDDDPWWPRHDREYLMSWHLATLLLAVQQWMGQQERDAVRTTRDLCALWDKLHDLVRMVLLADIEITMPVEVSTEEHMRSHHYSTILASISGAMRAETWAGIVAAHAQSLNLEAENWGIEVVAMRGQSALMLRDLYARVDTLPAHARTQELARLGGQRVSYMGDRSHDLLPALMPVINRIRHVTHANTLTNRIADQSVHLRQAVRRIPEMMQERLRTGLLRYWTVALPHNVSAWRAINRQIGLGVLMILIGAGAVALRWVVPGLVVGVIGIVLGIVLAVLGVGIAVASYPISVAYAYDFPGGFDPALEEYTARRVSSLSKEAFIPQYETLEYSANKKIRELNRRVRLALKAEKLWLEQSEHTSSASVCGILVVGPRLTNKTGALWDAMAEELSKWTIIRWPHHMDYPANLAECVGHHIVLWIDDLYEFANPGEASALNQFVEQLRALQWRAPQRRVLILASCRDGQNLTEAERYFRPLMNDLHRVNAQEIVTLQSPGSVWERAFKELSPAQQMMLLTIEWLESLHIYTFPEEVLPILTNLLLHPDNSGGLTLDSIWTLARHPARFIRIDQRVEAQRPLADNQYDIGQWLRYTVVPMRSHNREERGVVGYMVEPINTRYLNFYVPARDIITITRIIEKHPQFIIELLAKSRHAAETLVLLGDAYMNYLSNYIDNAAELAIECYKGALRQLDTGELPEQFPGAWAAALIGKGTAELRAGNPDKADEAFSKVTKRPAPSGDTRPIPPLLIARAWHGKGDVIAAKIPSYEATEKLWEAASFYAEATKLLPQSDPLAAEARLDRANILYEIAQAASKTYERSQFSTLIQPLIGEIEAAQQAYEETLQDYSQTVGAMVWAEVQRRQGDLCLMQTRYLLPAETLWPQVVVAGVPAASDPQANLEQALTTAKQAREYFLAACNIFAPSYLPRSWAQAQVGLVQALLIIARIVAPTSKSQARSLYASCLDITRDTVQKVYPRTDFPLDWVDLQLLRAQAEIGLGALNEGDAPGQYQHAKMILKRTEMLLDAYARLPENPNSERINAQRATLAALL